MSSSVGAHLLGAAPGATVGGRAAGLFSLLPLIVFVPAISAVLVALVPRSRPSMARALGLVGSLVTLALAVVMAVRFHAGVPGYQFFVSHSWIPAFGITFRVGVDGISVFLVAVTAVLFPIAMLGPRVDRDPKGYLAWMLLLEAACLGSFMALDIFVFFVFFELTLPPMYFLIGNWGDSDERARSYAAIKFFLYTFAGSALMLIALLATVFIEARSTGHVTFDLLSLTANSHFSAGVGAVLFLGFAAAFAVKVPLFPLHTWLPAAQAEASTGGSMVLAGVMFNLGTYGFVRYGIQLFPRAAVDLAPLMLTLGAIGIVYGFLVAIVQRDLKRMIAYTLVADLGVIVVGLFAFTNQGLSGGVYQMVNHGVTMGAMFLLIGVIIEKTGTRHLPAMGGLQAKAPLLAAAFLVVTLSAVGVPGLNGFIGEFLLLLGTFITHRWWAVVATSGIIFAALVFLWAYQQVFHGSPAGERKVPAEEGQPSGVTGAARSAITDLGWRDGLAVAPLVVLIVLLGVYPRPFLDRINPSTSQVLAHVTSIAHNPQPSVAAGTSSGSGGQP
jgi:NADH-quinone oxidoreductase subunit M